MIYFIRATQSGAIKIGVSNDPRRRLETMQTGSSEILELIGVMPGQADTERALHRRYAKFRIHGEWFKGAPELLAQINAMVSGQGTQSVQSLVDNTGSQLWLIRGSANFNGGGCHVELVCVCRERGRHLPDLDAMLDAVHSGGVFDDVDMVLNVTSRRKHWPADEEVLREPLTSSLATEWSARFESSDQFFPVLSLQQKQAMRSHPMANAQIGSTVLHPQYGIGKVMALHGFGQDRKVRINFTIGGGKTFVLERSPLRLVGGGDPAWSPSSS